MAPYERPNLYWLEDNRAPSLLSGSTPRSVSVEMDESGTDYTPD